LRTGFIDGDSSAVKFLAVEHFDRLLRFFFSGHFHEAKALGAAGHLVHNHDSGFNRAGLSEIVFQSTILGAVRQSADI